MRKFISRLNAGAAATATVLAISAGTAAPSAHAAECHQWSVPGAMVLVQNNGWTINVNKRYGSAYGYGSGNDRLSSQKVTFTSFTPDRIKFIISWRNGSSGVYTGRIDSDGFMTGRTADRFNRNTTSWHMRGHATCRN